MFCYIKITVANILANARVDFYCTDYDEATGKVGNDKVERDIVGYQVIQQYLSAIWIIHAVQKRPGLVKSEVGSLMSDHLKDLVQLVGKCKQRVMVELYKERLDGEF